MVDDPHKTSNHHGEKDDDDNGKPQLVGDPVASLVVGLIVVLIRLASLLESLVPQQQNNDSKKTKEYNNATANLPVDTPSTIPMVQNSSSSSSLPWLRPCRQHPFVSVLFDSLETITANRKDWLDHTRTLYGSMATLPNYQEWNQERFYPFAFLTPCPRECVGGKCLQVESKIACGMDTLNQLLVPPQ